MSVRSEAVNRLCKVSGCWECCGWLSWLNCKNFTGLGAWAGTGMFAENVGVSYFRLFPV
jgi:hypothetical protein